MPGAIPSDAPVIMHGIETELGRPVYGMADNLFRALPVVGTLWSRGGGLPAHPDNAYRLLHDEQQLALAFPEGTKATGKLARERYQLRRFGRGGFVEIAMRAGVPVVPLAIIGNEEAMPIVFKSGRLAKLLNIPYFPVTANQFVFGPLLGLVVPLPAKFRIRVLPPVHFDAAPNQERYNRSVVMDHAERIRDSIQDALYDLLRNRRACGSADADPAHGSGDVSSAAGWPRCSRPSRRSSSWWASTPVSRSCPWSAPSTCGPTRRSRSWSGS